MCEHIQSADFKAGLADLVCGADLPMHRLAAWPSVTVLAQLKLTLNLSLQSIPSFVALGSRQLSVQRIVLIVIWDNKTLFTVKKRELLVPFSGFCVFSEQISLVSARCHSP